MTNTKKLTASAIMIALATVLMWVSKLIPAVWLQGGSVTLASMVPIIIIGVKFGTKWGISSAFAYSLIQMMFGFYPPPTQTALYFILVILLDYVFAYGVLGLSGVFYNILSKNKSFALAFSGFAVTLLRYICHIISGILIWGVYAGEGQSVLAYSLIYNGSYMIPEILITTIALWVMRKRILK